MKNLALCFQIHHPFHFRTYRFLDIGKSHYYYDDQRIEKEITDAIYNSYLPNNEFLLKLIERYQGELKLLFYISGNSLDQFMMFAPEVISSFRMLADTGCVKFAGGTNSHSIASFANHADEFEIQVREYKQRINHYFNQDPKIFVNSDLLFSNLICDQLTESGYDSILINGSKKILQWRSPNYLYESQGDKSISIFFRNEIMSNQFTSMLLNTDKFKIKKQLNRFISALETYDPEEPQLIIYCNYLDLCGPEISAKQLFFQQFVNEILQNGIFHFNLPEEIQKLYGPIAEIGTDEPLCWVEHFSDLYYPGNELQQEALLELFKLEKKMKNISNPDLQIDWKYLQTTNHFHLMDENHPSYQLGSPNQSVFRSKYEAFINYMNILEDFRERLKKERLIKKNQGKSKSKREKQS